MHMELDGQRVVLLGGTSGIGLGAAKCAAAHGAEVVVVSSREENVRETLQMLPDSASGEVADFSDPAAIEAVIGRIGRLDHLIYTAGEPLYISPVEYLDVATAREYFQIRFFGALAAAKAARSRMPDSGSIIVTAGVAKDRPGYGWAGPASISGALEALTKALAVEFAPVRVNCVAPGVIRSPLWQGTLHVEEMYQQIADTSLAGRVGEVEDVAKAYLYLMTQEYSTGIVLTVDGGITLV